MDLMENMSGLAQRFKVATEQQDWQALAELDEEVRAQVKGLQNQTLTTADVIQVKRLLERIQLIYRLTISGAEQHRDQIARELSKLSRDQKAVASYQNSGQL